MKLWKVEDRTSDNNQELLAFIEKLVPFFLEKKPFDKQVTIVLKSDSKNAAKILGKTGYYSPDSNTICVYTDKRHPKDIMRSLSHELIHHFQNCQGKFEDLQNLEDDYTQTDPVLRELESEAYLFGNGLIFRDFEDSQKKSQEISLTEDISELEWLGKRLFEALLSKIED